MRSLMRTAWLLMAVSEIAAGCSLRAYELQAVRPDFVVVITHQGQPIRDAEVSVITGAQNAQPVFNAKTDDSGSVKVEGLQPGKYYLIAIFEGIEAGREWIEVGGSSKRTRRSFKFQWADYSERVRRVSGSLSGIKKGETGNPVQDLLHAQRVPERGVQIALRNAFSGERYKTISDSEGKFWFDSLSSGTYILSIAGGARSLSGIMADDSTFVVDLSTSAKSDFLRLALKDGGCGGAAYDLETGSQDQF